MTDLASDLRQAPPSDTIRITALGQAGFALTGRSTLLLIDPFLSPRVDRRIPPAVDPRGLTTVTYVLATHEHGDHLDVATWRDIALASPQARFVVPGPLVDLAADVVGARRIIAAARSTLALDGAVLVAGVPACHAVRIEDGYSVGSDDGLGARFLGYVVALDGVRVYHAGDTIGYPTQVDVVRSLEPAVALVPVNGRSPAREARGVVGNLRPAEAAGLVRDLGVGLAIPMHHDTIRGNGGGAGPFVQANLARPGGPSVAVLTAGRSILVPTEFARP